MIFTEHLQEELCVHFWVIDLSARFIAFNDSDKH